MGDKSHPGAGVWGAVHGSRCQQDRGELGQEPACLKAIVLPEQEQNCLRIKSGSLLPPEHFLYRGIYGLVKSMFSFGS